MDILIYLPPDASKPVPVFLNLSFSANATVADDPGIKAGYIWGREGKKVPGKPVLNDLGYLIHSGGHGTVPEDFPVFIKFMKMHFFNDN